MTEKTILEQIISSDNKKEKGELELWKFGDSLKEFIAQDSANKLDSREQTITGAELTDEMKSVLKLSRWKKLRKKLGKELSRSGQAALVIDIINKQPFVSMGDLTDFTRVGGVLHEVLLTTSEIVEYESSNYPIIERFYIDGDRVKKMYAIKVGKRWISQGNEMVYDKNITRIPVTIFDNNEEGTSDIANTKMFDAIQMLSDFTSQFPEVYELSQFGLLVNRNMTGGKTGKQLLESYKRNKVIEVNGVDAQLGSGVSPIGSPGYITELMVMVDYLEDKILKYTFTTRDTTSSGANKHNAEVGMFNQFAIEYLLDKKEIREEDYADFYQLLAMFYKIDFSAVVVELEISQVLQNLLDAMNPETPQVQENINKDETNDESSEEEK